MSVWIDIFHVPFRPRRLPERYISKIRSTRDRLQCMYAYGQTMRYESAEVRTKNEKIRQLCANEKTIYKLFFIAKNTAKECVCWAISVFCGLCSVQRTIFFSSGVFCSNELWCVCARAYVSFSLQCAMQRMRQFSAF